MNRPELRNGRAVRSLPVFLLRFFSFCSLVSFIVSFLSLHRLGILHNQSAGSVHVRKRPIGRSATVIPRLVCPAHRRAATCFSYSFYLFYLLVSNMIGKEGDVSIYSQNE